MLLAILLGGCARLDPPPPAREARAADSEIAARITRAWFEAQIEGWTEIEVVVRGRRIVLGGPVVSPAERQRLLAVAADHAEGREIVDELRVFGADGPR